MIEAFREINDNYIFYNMCEKTYPNIQNEAMRLQNMKNIQKVNEKKLDDAYNDQESIQNRLIKLISDRETKANIRNEISTIEHVYDDISTIRDSLSSTKGIPLIFIKLYLKNIQILANKILQEMFDENISLEDFVIDENDFFIPVKINGLRVKDVASASQGQKSTIILALSFALMQQFISDYNILLIDEIDGPLYKENKEKFISIVEKNMSAIGCEQCIMITHNNFFEQYPINLISTSNEDESNYKQAKVLFKPKKE